MAPITIYGMRVSAPCRNLLMVSEILGLEYELKLVILKKEENKTPEYLKLNPHHTVPTLVDGDFVTSESRPAAAYLITKHGGEKRKQLYPEDPETRCLIDQRMYFDMGTLYKAFGDCVVGSKNGTGLTLCPLANLTCLISVPDHDGPSE